MLARPQDSVQSASCEGLDQLDHLTPPSLLKSEQEFHGSTPVSHVDHNLQFAKEIGQEVPSPCNYFEQEEAQLLEEFQGSSSPDDTLVKVDVGPQHFDLLKLIGEGAFGKVILVRNRLSRQLHAMKVISKKLLRKKNNVRYMKSERNILTKMDHPFVVSLHFAFQSEKKLFLVMDFLGGGELFFHLKRRGSLTEKEVQFYLAEIVLAIEFLHNRGIIHRDLKPENVLLRSDSHICLTDFGLAKEITEGESVRTLCGTSEYMAPEMVSRNGYSKSVDWWAAGALCFEMFTGRPPFTAKTEKELYKKILSEKPVLPPYLTSSAHSIIKGLLEKDMNKRLGSSKTTMFSVGQVAALKQHSFFQGLDWAALANLSISPPIDVMSTRYAEPSDKPPQGTKGNNNNLNEDKTPSNDYDEIDDELAEQELTIHFHEGFTTQCLSPSVVEDVASPTSERSRANSLDQEEFEEFSFVGRPVECTTKQFEEFEQDLAIRKAKIEKKRALRLRKEQEKAALLAKQEEEKREKARLEQRAREEEARLAREARELAERQIAEQNRRLAEEQARKERKVERDRREALWTEYEAKLAAVQKKLRNARKKLKDVVELVQKVESLKQEVPREQKEKISRRQELEDDVSELEEQEYLLLTEKPPERIPPEGDEVADAVSKAVSTPTGSEKTVRIGEVTVVTADPPKPIEVTVPLESQSSCLKTDGRMPNSFQQATATVANAEEAVHADKLKATCSPTKVSPDGDWSTVPSTGKSSSNPSTAAAVNTSLLPKGSTWGKKPTTPSGNSDAVKFAQEKDSMKLPTTSTEKAPPPDLQSNWRSNLVSASSVAEDANNSGSWRKPSASKPATLSGSIGSVDRSSEAASSTNHGKTAQPTAASPWSSGSFANRLKSAEPPAVASNQRKT